MPSVRRLKTSEDVRKALATWLRMIETGALEISKGKALIYGCSVLTQIIVASDVEKRIEALEQGKEGV